MKQSLPLLLLSCLLLSSCNLTYKILRYNVPDITDHQLFEEKLVCDAGDPLCFAQTDNQPLPAPETWALYKKKFKGDPVESFLAKTHTTSFMVLKNDTIIYENYFNGFQRDSISQVFSITKAVVSALVGIAIAEGDIKSLEQPVADFIPEFGKDDRQHIQIGHLLNMTSGLAFDDYRTLLKVLRLYYNPKIDQFIRKVKLKHEPGTHFAYKSISTQVLGVCLEQATGRSVADYLEEKIWRPAGMARPAEWNLATGSRDEIMFGGLCTHARDLAKFGRLYLNNGRCGERQIVPKGWVLRSRQRDTTGGNWWGYSNCWWLDTYCEKDEYYKGDSDEPPCAEVFEMTDFFAAGFRGQYVYVNPEHNIIIVRQGLKEGKVRWSKSLPRLAAVIAEQPAPVTHKATAE